MGSPSLREELFDTHVKTLASAAAAAVYESEAIHQESEADRKKRDKERKEQAVREREEQVRRNEDCVERDLGRSKNAMSGEVGESQCMYALLLSLSRN